MMVPVAKALDADEDIESVVAVTLQRGKLLDQVLDLFAIKPDSNNKQGLGGGRTRKEA